MSQEESINIPEENIAFQIKGSGLTVTAFKSGSKDPYTPLKSSNYMVSGTLNPLTVKSATLSGFDFAQEKEVLTLTLVINLYEDTEEVQDLNG